MRSGADLWIQGEYGGLEPSQGRNLEYHWFNLPYLLIGIIESLCSIPMGRGSLTV